MKKLLNDIVAAAEAKSAQNIVVLNVRNASRSIDFIVIMSAESRPQLRAIVRAIAEKLKRKIKWEGEMESGWLILDLGSIVVHVMDEEERAYYNLEELWGPEAVVYHI